MAPKPEYPDGVLPRNELPVDPWGNGYGYQVTEDGFHWNGKMVGLIRGIT